MTMETPSRRVADLVLESLVESGIDTFYGVPGGTIAPLYDAVLAWQFAGRRPRIKLINTRHETGAMFMAMGHARATDHVAAVLTTSGPGVTNALTGIAAAWADRVPVVVLSGEVPRARYGRGALQEGSAYGLDVLNMARSITSFCTEVSHPNNAAFAVRKAVHMARAARRGPSLLTLPLDVLSAQAMPAIGQHRVSMRSELDEGAVREAARLLHGATRGVIFAGAGVHDPRARVALRRLSEALHMPVMTSPKGKGCFPEDSPLALGVFGYGGHASARAYLEKGCDVMLCVGCGLGEVATHAWNPLLTPSRALVQIDADPSQFGRNYPVAVAIVGEAHEALERMLERMEPRKGGPTHGGLRLDAPDLARTDRAVMHPARAVTLLQECAPPNTLFTSDIGEHLLFALHYLRVKEPGGFLASLGLGSMGSGIGAAIGARVARPDRPVIAMCGDYGFQMYGMELSTCVQERVGAVFAVFNDARMRMVESGNMQVFGRTPPMHGPRVDFAALARSVGAQGLVLRTRDDFARLPKNLWHRNAPCVLDIHVDPDASFSNNGRAQQFAHFHAAPSPRAAAAPSQHAH